MYAWDDIEAALIVGAAAFVEAYITDGLAMAILAGLVLFLASLACFETARVHRRRLG